MNKTYIYTLKNIYFFNYFRGVSPYLDENVGILKHAILSLCNFYYTFTAYEFDTYYPGKKNEYFDIHYILNSFFF